MIFLRANAGSIARAILIGVVSGVVLAVLGPLARAPRTEPLCPPCPSIPAPAPSAPAPDAPQGHDAGGALADDVGGA